MPEAETRRIFHRLDALADWSAPEGELSVAFLTREEMCRLHADFLQDASLTDVITFQGDPAAGLAGEICVAPVSAYEFKHSRRLPFAEELTLYLVHGYLHLAGLDDVDPTDRRKMRTAEHRAMDHLRSVDAIPRFDYPAEQRTGPADPQNNT